MPVSFTLKLQILSGISPVKLLRSKSNSVKLVNVSAGMSGIVPVSSLPSKYKSRMSGGVANVGGTGPENVLFEK